MEPNSLGPCPLCGREMFEGLSVNKHHVMPKCVGGTELHWMHVVCHSKIHATLSIHDLRTWYHTFERLREHPELAKFIRWVRRKPPGFRVRHKKSRSRRR